MMDAGLIPVGTVPIAVSVPITQSHVILNNVLSVQFAT